MREKLKNSNQKIIPRKESERRWKEESEEEVDASNESESDKKEERMALGSKCVMITRHLGYS